MLPQWLRRQHVQKSASVMMLETLGCRALALALALAVLAQHPLAQGTSLHAEMHLPAGDRSSRAQLFRCRILLEPVLVRVSDDERTVYTSVASSSNTVQAADLYSTCICKGTS
jgi:hypothetical protein